MHLEEIRKKLNTLSIPAVILAIGVCVAAVITSKAFGFYFITAEFITVICVAFAFSFLLLFNKYSFPRIQSPHSSQWISYTICALALFVLISIFQDNAGERLTGLSLIALFLSLSLSISALVLKSGPAHFLKSFIYVLIPFVLYTFIALLTGDLILKSPVKLFFGNPNIASNYVALATLQVAFFYQYINQKHFKVCAILLALTGVSILILFQSRAALLGLIFGLIYYFYFFYKKQLWAKRQILISLLFILGSAFAYVQYQKGFESLKNRFSLWQNTLCLIKDYPLGVGPGSFEYVFQHYNGKCVPAREIGEGLNVRNPHNAFLEFFAEIGIGGGLALFLLLFLLFRRMQNLSEKSYPTEVAWVRATSLVFLGIALFEFPQDTPMTFFFLAILCGMLLALVADVSKSSKTQERFSKKKLFFLIAHLCVTLVAGSLLLLKYYSDHLTYLPGKDRDRNFSYKKAYLLDSENWKASTFLILNHIDKNEFEVAEKMIAKMENTFKGHHTILHLRGYLALAQKDNQSACYHFKKYHSLFGQNSSKKEWIEKNCN